MKNKVSFYVSIFASLSILTLIIAFKTTPQSQLWKGYKILYAPKSIELGAVESVLQGEKISGVISKNSQKVPVISKFAPVQIQTSSSYLLRREGFFTDKSETYNIFYIPEKYASKIPGAIEILNKSFPNVNEKSGMDGQGKKSIVPPLIALLAFLAALYFSENMVAFGVLEFFPLVFVFANPFFCVAGSFLLSMVAFYTIQKIYKRTGAFSILKKSIICSVFLAAPGVLLAFSYIKLSLFYFLAHLASFSNFYIFMVVSKIIENHIYSFNPTLILSAKSVPLIEKNGLNVLFASAASVFILLVASIFAGGLSTISTTSDTSSINLPLPVAKSEDNSLPNANDFSVWAWNTLSFPFKKLDPKTIGMQNVPKDGEKIEFSGVSPFDDKVFTSSYNTLTYNNSFRQNLYKNAEKIDESVEKLILTQGEKTNFTYGKKAGSANEKFKVLILSVFLCASFGAALFYFLTFRKQSGSNGGNNNQ